MPYMINGIGTTVYKGRGDVGWGSFDSVEWFVFFFAPLIPIRPIHTFGWSGKRYRLVPIRWSAALVVRSFLRIWRWLFIVVGGILLFAGAVPALLIATGDRKPVDLLNILGMLASARCCWPVASSCTSCLLPRIAAPTICAASSARTNSAHAIRRRCKSR